MTSLYSLTKQVGVDDYLAWVGEKADISEQVHPKQVTNIDDHGETIRVDGEGIGGGTYFYRVDTSGGSEAFYVDPNKSEPTSMGEVVFAELTDSDDPVSLNRGYHDSR